MRQGFISTKGGGESSLISFFSTLSLGGAEQGIMLGEEVVEEVDEEKKGIQNSSAAETAAAAGVRATGPVDHPQ